MPRGRTRASPPNGAETLTSQLTAQHEDALLRHGGARALPLLKPHGDGAPAALPLPSSFADPRAYFASMQSMVFDEAVAMVNDGLQQRRRPGTKLVLSEVLRVADTHSAVSLGRMSFEPSGAGSTSAKEDRVTRTGSVVLLESRSGSEQSVLAVVDGRSSRLRFEVHERSLLRVERAAAAALATRAVWTATPIASVLVQQRCIDVCLRRPKPPFMRSLLGGAPPTRGTHTRFVDGEAVEAHEEGSGGDRGREPGAAEGPRSDGEQQQRHHHHHRRRHPRYYHHHRRCRRRRRL